VFRFHTITEDHVTNYPCGNYLNHHRSIKQQYHMWVRPWVKVWC